MKSSFWFGGIVLAGVFMLAGTSAEIQAAPAKGPAHVSHVSHVSHVNHGPHYASHYGGYHSFYHGGHAYNFHYYQSHYHGWSRYCWFPNFRCYGYFCPEDSCWYYWNAQYSCYMPTTYISTFAPTPVAAPAPVGFAPVNTNVNVNTNAVGNTGNIGLPTGAVPVSPGNVPFPGDAPMPGQ